MNKDEALKLALEALERAERDGGWSIATTKAITAIKQALAAPTVQETPFQIGQRLRQEGKGISDLWGAVSSDADMSEASRGFDYAAQPAPVQEPVATVIKKGADRQWMSERLASLPDGIYSLYTTPPAAAVQEGRDWSLLEATQESLREHIAEIKRLKAAQRQWVGLSQDELDAMFSNTIKGKKLVNWVARAIEAKLKEKNT